MFWVSWLSIFLSESVNGPVALITHLAFTSNSFPVRVMMMMMMMRH